MSTSNNDLDNLNKPHSTRRILFFISYSAGIIVFANKETGQGPGVFNPLGIQTTD